MSYSNYTATSIHNIDEENRIRNLKNDPIIWRCISYKGISGGMNWFRQSVMFDDMIATERMQEYMKTLEERGVEKVTVKRLGRLSQVMERGMNPIRAGAERISYEKKIHKLEEYIDVK